MALLRGKYRSKMTLPEGQVNITALMDVLTVLLFFLIKSFSMSTNIQSPPKDIRLPASEYKEKVEHAVTLALSAKALYVDGEVFMKLEKGKFDPADVGNDGRTLPKLKAYLIDQAKKKFKIFKGAKKEHLQHLVKGRLLFEADKDLPFGSIKHVLHTAAISSYQDYQFVIENQED